jgi:hypothetical protein
MSTELLQKGGEIIHTPRKAQFDCSYKILSVGFEWLRNNLMKREAAGLKIRDATNNIKFSFVST